MSNSNESIPPEANFDNNFGVILKKVGVDAKPVQQEELNKYQQIIAKQSFKPNLLNEDDVLIEILKKVPFLAGFLKRLDDLGENLSKFKEIEHASNLSRLVHSFQYAGLAINALNFLYIPALYLASFIYDKKVPFTLPNNLKIAYAGVMVALSAVALTSPVIAPFIAIALSGSALVLGVGAVYSHYRDRGILGKRLDELNLEIRDARNEMTALQNQVRALDPNAPAIEGLFEQFEQAREKMQSLYDERAQKEQVYAGLGWDAGLIKASTVIIGAVMLAGIALSIFFPPLGITMIAAAAGAGCSLVFVTLGKSIIGGIMDYFRTPKKEKSKTEEEELDYAQTGPTLELQLTIDNENTVSDELGCSQKSDSEQGLTESESGLPEVEAPVIPSPKPSLIKPVSKLKPLSSPSPKAADDEEEGEGEHPHPHL